MTRTRRFAVPAKHGHSARLRIEALEDRRMLSVSPDGPEFQVNTFTTGHQDAVSVAMDDVGNFVVVWESNGQDGHLEGVYAQRYDAAGMAQGGEFLVNTYTANDQGNPSVAMDADGDFVVVWESGNQEFSGRKIYAQRYNAAGVAQGSEFRVNTYTPFHQWSPSVAMDADGDFVVAWNSYGQDGSGYGIYAQRYNSAGVAQGSEFQVNTYTANSQLFSTVAMDADGDFVVAWISYGQDGSEYGIYAQRYNSAGVAQGSEFQVNTYTTGNQIVSSVAMDADGDFVAVWHSYGQDGQDYGTYAQRYNAAGVAQGSEFRLNAYTTGRQGLSSVAMDADGDFVVSWTSYGQDGSHYGVYVQRYDAAGVAQGSEFQVNTYTTDAQGISSVAMDADGDFVVAWQSNGQDGDAYGVFAQRYSASLAPSTVTDRQLYYNNSAYDGLTAGATSAAQEYSALATDKSAYLPGSGTFGVANTSSYSNGITGVIVEITGAHGTLTLDDFTVRVSGQQLSANNVVSSWAAAPAPTIAVFTDTPVAGTDRVHLTWADGAITDRYLEVVVEGDDAAGGNNTNTGLAASDIFLFASKIGDDFTGGPTFGNTNATDELNARSNQGVASILPTNSYDFNRDFFVNSTDQLIARGNQGFLQWFSFSNPPAAPAPPGGDDDGSAIVIAPAGPTSALDEDDASSAVAAAWTIPSLKVQSRSASSSAAPLPAAEVRHALSSSGSQVPPAINAPRGRANGKANDAVIETLNLEEDLLESLLSRLRRAD